MIISNLRQIYKGKEILNIKELNIDENKITALTGSNGSGKSTLLRIISGIEKPFCANITTRLKPFEISILLPEPVLLKRSVRRNFEFVAKNYKFIDEFNERVKEALDLVGLDLSFLNKDYYELSSGQTQRLAFALVLAVRNKLILLDEPTNSVDLGTSKLFSKAILYMKEKYGCGFIIASHDEKWLSALAQDLIFLHNGRLNEFELKNIFDVNEGKIKFSDNLFIKLPSSFVNAKKVALDPEKIKLNTVFTDGYNEGILHSVSIVYSTKLLVKIKFGEFLIKTTVFIDEFKNCRLITGDKIFFEIQDSAYFKLE